MVLSKKKIIFISLILLVAITLILVGYLCFKYVDKNDNQILNSNPLLGKINLTLFKKGGDRVGLYSYDLEKKELSTFYGSEQEDAITGKFRIQDNLFITSSNYKSSDPFLFQLWTIDKNKKTKKITRSETYQKREPAWSPAGDKIAFVARELRESSDKEGLIVNEWDVYISDLKGNEEFITEGTHPLFSSNGKYLIVLKNDGLYLFDIETKEGKKIWNVENGDASASMKLDVLWNNDMLAWSFVGEKGKLVLFKIHSWDPFRGEVVNIIDTNSFWPMFSPDGKYLVVQEIDFNAESSNPRLIMYNVETSEKEFLLDLNEYEQFAMWINDWIN